MRQEKMGFWGGSASAEPYANNLYLTPDSITTPTPHHSTFTGRMLFLTSNQQCQSTEGTSFNIVTATENDIIHVSVWFTLGKNEKNAASDI